MDTTKKKFDKVKKYDNIKLSYNLTEGLIKMRFSCRIKLNKENGNILIPTDYRKYISSMIKEAFKLSGDDGETFLNEYFSSNKMKPYTFSVYFPIKEIKEDKFVLQDDNFLFNFSSSDYEFLMRIYNGLLKIKNGFELFNDQISVEKFNLQIKPDYTFKDKILFKTLSPFLVRDLKDGDYYLLPKGLLKDKKFKYAKESNKEEFIEALKKSIINLAQEYLKEKFDEKKEIAINILWETLKLAPVAHSSNRSKFSITLPSIRGCIEISAQPELLKLIYDAGIGARRSEGFGMLEVIK
jgi:CRISPR-associated endoribonuclease Cas6